MVGACGRINASSVLARKPEGRRLLGKQCRWEDDITKSSESEGNELSEAKDFSSAKDSTERMSSR